MWRASDCQSSRIVQNERLFSELLEKTVRSGQKEVQQGLSMAYQIGVDKAVPVERNWSLQCGSLCRG